MEDFTSDTQVHANSLRAVILLILSLLVFSSYSQSNLSTSNKKAAKLYFKADKKYKERDFESALMFLEESVVKDAAFFEAYARMGSLYNALGQLDSVYSKFSKYIQVAPDPIASILERTASLAFDRGDYLEAEEYLSLFLEKVPEKGSDRIIILLQQSIEFAKEQLKSPMQLEINELSKTINNYQLQYLPAITIDQSTMIYTKRDVFSSDEDIVVSYKENGEWGPSQSISPRINTSLNEGACTISADGRTMIFTSCDRRNAMGSCDLYISRKTGARWSRPENLGKSVNSRYWESQPSLSADGKTLFFASNRPGGFGGRDIWMSINEEGKWSKPQNLGPNINSFKDETTPFIHFNGETLFFSSNSHPGMGGFDLFMSSTIDTTWTLPLNLGYPINTYRDEVALLVSADGQSGFFAKEQLKNREILDSRIVSVDIPEQLRPAASSYIVGKVIDAISKRPLKANIQVYDINTNQKFYDNSSDSISGEYYMVLPPGKELACYIKKKGYLFKDFSFSSTLGSPDTISIELSPIQEGTSLVLNNIYFETDSYELDQRSLSEIQSIAEILQDNPTMQIEIGGHTDDIGAKEYNQSLSEKRARSVFESLRKEGIRAERVQYVGFGDSKPLVPNDSDKNRQSNRRIEFRVLRLSQ